LYGSKRLASQRKLIIYSRMPTRRNRNGPMSRLLSPVNEGLGLVTRTGSRVLRTTNSVWNKLGQGVRGVFGNATRAVNTAGRRVLTGHRGGKRSRKHTRKHSRKHGKKHSRKH
jgi:hypothetical protein